jgi:4-phytase/acid phosphatase
MTRRLLFAGCLFAFFHAFNVTQVAALSSGNDGEDLKYVVYVSRHGVRSPTAKISQYSLYSSAPWPTWEVPPGYLTQHGYGLMKLLGAFDRRLLAHDGLLSSDGCDGANDVTLYADSDQRTHETGKALAEGLFPGCSLPVLGLPEGTNDPLFHMKSGSIDSQDATLAVAAMAGRLGGNADNLADAYHKQIASLDEILSTCGTATITPHQRTPLLEIPANLTIGKSDHLAELHGPLNTSSTLVENLLLEYTEGMNISNVGWGRVDGSKLRSLMDLHTAAVDYTQRTPFIAKMQASNLLDHIHRSIEQAITQGSIDGAPGKPKDRALFLIGHDTNLTNIAGLLNLNWIIDGRRDDTPPGGALIFELWKERKTGNYSVRTYFTAQTLEQMRSAVPLTLEHPPERVPVFIPGCSKEDYSCTWPAFSQTIRQAVDLRYVKQDKRHPRRR